LLPRHPLRLRAARALRRAAARAAPPVARLSAPRPSRALRAARSAASAIACAALLGAPTASAAGYEELRARAVAACRAIDPAESQSGLLFNPDGYRSYYVRSECLQRAAVEFRDGSLCAEVKQRRAWFSSSWGVSRRRCRELVAEGAAADRAALEEARRRYAAGG